MDTRKTIRLSKNLESLIQKVADKRGIRWSEMARLILTENVSDYKGLTPREQKVAEVMKKEERDDMDSTIIERKLKEETYIPYVREQVKSLHEQGLENEKILEVLQTMRPVAERRGCLEEFESYVQSVGDGDAPELKSSELWADG